MVFDDEYYMRLALAEAEKAYELGEIPVGCVVVAQDRIIAKTHNLTEQLIDVTAHAEVQAISSSANHIGGKYLKNCTMYITLEPCVMCAGALYWSQISKVVIGALDEKRGYTSAGLKLHPKTEIVSGVLQEECRMILQDFFKKKR